MAIVKVPGHEAASSPPVQVIEYRDARPDRSLIGRFLASNKLRATVLKRLSIMPGQKSWI
jgi:hypothetical protein